MECIYREFLLYHGNIYRRLPSIRFHIFISYPSRELATSWTTSDSTPYHRSCCLNLIHLVYKCRPKSLPTSLHLSSYSSAAGCFQYLNLNAIVIINVSHHSSLHFCDVPSRSRKIEMCLDGFGFPISSIKLERNLTVVLLQELLLFVKGSAILSFRHMLGQVVEVQEMVRFSVPFYIPFNVPQ